MPLDLTNTLTQLTQATVGLEAGAGGVVPSLSPPGSPTTVGNYGEWFTVRLAGTALPGKWTVRAGAIELKVDRKPKAGVDGANPVFHGMDPKRFELEGEQFNDAERTSLAIVLRQICPQPGMSQFQKPVTLMHPSVMHFGFAIHVVVLGCSVLEHVGPSVTRVRLSMRHWLPEQRNAPSATNQPTRSVRNNRNFRNSVTESTGGPTPPSQQPGAFDPPKQAGEGS